MSAESEALAAAAAQMYALMQELKRSNVRTLHGADAGGVNAIALNPAPALTAWSDDVILVVDILAANTQANVTIQVSALAPIPVRWANGAVLSAGDVVGTMVFKIFGAPNTGYVAQIIGRSAPGGAGGGGGGSEPYGVESMMTKDDVAKKYGVKKADVAQFGIGRLATGLEAKSGVTNVGANGAGPALLTPEALGPKIAPKPGVDVGDFVFQTVTLGLYQSIGNFWTMGVTTATGAQLTTGTVPGFAGYAQYGINTAQQEFTAPLVGVNGTLSGAWKLIGWFVTQSVTVAPQWIAIWQRMPDA